MTVEHRLAYLNRAEITARAPAAVLVLPLGATEQHGPHLPTGTDHLLVERIALSAADAVAGRLDAIVAPTVPFGFSAHHLSFGATVTISTRTLQAFLEEACQSLLASGFRRILILNGHGGNEELIRVVARQVGTDSGAVIAAASYWVVAWDRLVAAGISRLGRLPGHAGAFETSLVAAAFPELAAEQLPSRPDAPETRQRYHPDVQLEDRREWVRSDGFSDNPAGADEAAGRRALTEIVSAVADALAALPEPP